jgi:LysM repeat protein
MAGRSPARFLAPLALVGFVVALVIVIGGSSSQVGDEEGAGTPVRSSTPTSGSKTTKPAKSRPTKTTKTYTIKPGDTPSGIASAHGITTEKLLELNPRLDPGNLTVGEKVKVE